MLLIIYDEFQRRLVIIRWRDQIFEGGFLLLFNDKSICGSVFEGRGGLPTFCP